MNGNADISDNLSIAASGQLIGDVKVGSFNIAQVGVFKGRSEMTTRTRSESVDD